MLGGMGDNPYRVKMSDLAPARPMTRNADPDGDEPPATATAYVADVPRERPNASTVEGMIAGFGDLSRAAVGDDPVQSRRARLLAGITLGAVAVGVPLGYVLSRAF